MRGTLRLSLLSAGGFLVVIAVMLMQPVAIAQEHAAATGATGVTGVTGTISAETIPATAPADGSAPVEGGAPPEPVATHEPAPLAEMPTTGHAVVEPAVVEHAAVEHAAVEHAPAAHGAGDQGEHEGVNYLPKIVNFLIFTSILVLVAGRPIAAFFGGRRKDIEESFTKAEAAQRDAASKLAEMEQRLAALDTQVKDILARAQDQAEGERQAILETARLDAQKLLTQAQAQVADLESASVRRLKAMAADLAVDGARELIEKQLGPDDRNRLFDRTLKGLSKASSQ